MNFDKRKTIKIICYLFNIIVIHDINLKKNVNTLCDIPLYLCFAACYSKNIFVVDHRTTIKMDIKYICHSWMVFLKKI